MSIFLETEKIKLTTNGQGEIHNITQQIELLIKKHQLQEGQLLIFVTGSTGALTTVEFEPGLVKDLQNFFERIAPQDAYYHHEETWHDGNGHSHVRASLIGPSLTIPVLDRALCTGTWQQIIFIDFDNQSNSDLLPDSRFSNDSCRG